MTTQRDDRCDAVRDGADETTIAPVVPVLPPRLPLGAAPVLGRHADGPTVPLAPAPEMPTAWRPDGVTVVHRSMNEQRRRGTLGPHRRSIARRIASWTLVAAAVAMGAVAVVQFSRGFQDARGARSLPTFADVRPVAGTAVIEVEEWVDDTAFSSTVTVNPISTDYRLDGVGTDDTVEMMRASGDTFVFDGTGWVQMDDESARLTDRDLIPMTRISIFTDYVPHAARPYVHVLEGAHTELRGRDVRRLELVLDDEAFRRGDREAFDAWIEENGVVADDADGRPFHLELWFDDDGVLWRVRSEGVNDAGGEPDEWVQIDLMSYGTGVFVAPPPSDVASTRPPIDSA